MFFSSSDWSSLVFRLTLALLVGGFIGINRQRSGRPAGLRTFMVVSLGAALFVMIPLQVERESNFAPPDAHNDEFSLHLFTSLAVKTLPANR